MASKRSKIETPIQTPPSISPDKGIELIKRQINDGLKVKEASCPGDEYDSWNTITNHCLVKAFGEHSEAVQDFETLGAIYAAGMDFDFDAFRREALDRKLARLGAYIKIFMTEVELQEATIPPPPLAPLIAISRKVFVVHGHNEAFRETCARFVEKLDLEPIILHEQPNAGRTIIEKFQDYSDVGFAIVLLTGDDQGTTKNADPSTLKLRARQNVIFELGFFIGKLGRSRVCALYEPGVEIPSDYSGILFVQLDPAGAWRFQLGRELKAVGIAVDLNRAI